MRRGSSSFLSMAVIGAVVTTGFMSRSAYAKETDGRPIVKGQLQDLYFPTGTTTTRTMNFTYEAYALPDWGYMAVNAGVISNVSGITVLPSYGCYAAQHPYTTQVGPAAPIGTGEKERSFDVTVSATVPAGVYTIGLWALRTEFYTCMEQIDDPNLTLIGTINVYVQSANPTTAFRVTGNAGNISGSMILIDHPFTNGNKYARLLVTQNLNPNGGGGVWNNRPVAVTYSSTEGKWAVANDDGSAMSVGVTYNVRLEGGTSAADSSAALRHVVPDGSGSVTYIDNPIINNNPYANVFVTRNRACLVGICFYIAFNKNVGVRYNSSNGRWGIFTQDGSSFPNNGLAFNVKAIGRPGIRSFGTPVHEVFVQQGNISGDATRITKSSTAHLGAILIATPNWNPNGVGGTSNNHATAVWCANCGFAGGNWWIRNQDGAVMPAAAAFNVWEPYPNIAQ